MIQISFYLALLTYIVYMQNLHYIMIVNLLYNLILPNYLLKKNVTSLKFVSDLKDGKQT
jgi:hypothetical protein